MLLAATDVMRHAVPRGRRVDFLAELDVGELLEEAEGASVPAAANLTDRRAGRGGAAIGLGAADRSAADAGPGHATLAASQRREASKEAVLVLVGSTEITRSVFQPLRLLVRSLREAGSDAEVIVFAHRKITQSLGDSGTRLVLVRPQSPPDGAVAWQRALLSAASQFVQKRRMQYARLLQVPAHTFFQSDPFAALFWPAAADGSDGGGDDDPGGGGGNNTQPRRDSRLKLFLSVPLAVDEPGGHPWAFDSNGASQDFVKGPSTGQDTCGSDWNKGTVKVFHAARVLFRTRTVLSCPTRAIYPAPPASATCHRLLPPTTACSRSHVPPSAPPLPVTFYPPLSQPLGAAAIAGP